MNKRLKRILFLKKNWKLGVHLILHTKRFGVNNAWWSRWDSIWGIPTKQILLDIIVVYPLLDNYRFMKFRAGCLHFMTDEQYELAFGGPKKR